MAFLEIRNLVRKAGAVEILKGINIDLEKGGFLVLVGPSGCGKSTLLNAIAGLQQPTSGEIIINGQVVNDLHPAKRDIAMVFQSYALYPNMTVEENIGFALEMRGMPKAERAEAIRGVAKTLQIEHLLTRRPAQLSGGQRQRVAMGRALVRKPQVFLFDEPLSNLDAKLRVEVRAEIKRLHQTTHATIVYVTHDQIEAMTLATKIVVMKEGIIQQVGSPSDIYNRPANTFVADFMGSPAMNMLPGRIDGGMVHLTGGTRLPLPGTVSAAPAQGTEVLLGIRPEAVTDRSLADPSAKHLIDIEAPVELTEPTGSDMFLILRHGGEALTARVRAEVAVEAGQTISVALNLDKAVLFEKATGQRIG
ncbi:MAG: ABC transporter ATP-binding protein [Pannonibacter sp.]|jgi:multiple sugar transport system ATP-binding protein